MREVVNSLGFLVPWGASQTVVGACGREASVVRVQPGSIPRKLPLQYRGCGSWSPQLPGPSVHCQSRLSLVAVSRLAAERAGKYRGLQYLVRTLLQVPSQQLQLKNTSNLATPVPGVLLARADTGVGQGSYGSACFG